MPELVHCSLQMGNSSFALSNFASALPWDDVSIKTPYGVMSGSIGTTTSNSTQFISPSPMKAAYAETVEVQRNSEERLFVQHTVINGVGFNVAYLLVLTSDDDGDGTWVASDLYSNVYGAGESQQQAIDDYVSGLIEHFQWLDSRREQLSPGLRAELSELSSRLRHIATT